MAVFPDEDRELYPEMFKLPAGCYEARSPCRENEAAQPRAGRLLRSLFRRSRTRLPRASANEAGRAASRAADHTALLFATQVSLPKPLGIAFEEVEPGKGVVVDYLVEGSNAEQCGRIQPGDILIAVTAYKVPPMTSRLPCLSVALSGCVSTDPASTRTPALCSHR